MEFGFVLTGGPRLKQLHADLRAAELDREAPRLSVPESQYRAMCGETWHEGGLLYELLDIREPQLAPPVEIGKFENSLGAFKLQSGATAFFVAHCGAPRR